MNSSNYTGRTHRTINSAFGPYTSHALAPMPEPIHPHDTIVLWGCAIGAVVAFVAVVVL
jgi:hypothetical protein